MKFARFVLVYVCITRGKNYYFRGKNGFSARNTNIYIQNLKTSHGYILRSLQNFTTKRRNFTNFKMLFLAVMKDLPRSKFGPLCNLVPRACDPLVEEPEALG